MTTMTVAVMIRLNGGNDNNGNPRRLFVGLDADGGIAGCWDEGYQGHGAVPPALRRKAAMALTFNVTPAEYKVLRNGFAENA